MPSSLVKKYAEETGKSVGDVEVIWNDVKKIVSKTYDKKKNPDAFWGTVNMIVRRKLKLEEEFEPNSFYKMKWQDVPYEEGTETEGDEIEDSEKMDKVKKTIKDLYKENAFATGTGTISVADTGSGNVPAGGAGNGVYADKVGDVQKRDKIPPTFSEWLKSFQDRYESGMIDTNEQSSEEV